MTDYPKCIWRLPDGNQCPEYAVYDGQCAIHLDYEEMRNDLGKEIFNLVLARVQDPKTVESLSDVIMNDVVGPHLEHMAARHIGYREENKAWAKRVDRRSSWARNLVQRFIDMRREKEKAEAAETRLRSDFGELAKDLKQVARQLAPAVGGDQHPVHGRWIMELHSWRATAEILADKELSDNLDEVRKAPIEDFGPVPRPDWRCHLHPNAEPMQRLNGTKICSDGMCIQAEGD
jgi:hypothetical protein